MPRQARITSETGIYHVILRGVNRMRVFLEEADFVDFLERINQQTEPSIAADGTMMKRCEIYAYCLMSNHIHLLIKEEDEPIGAVMKRITSGYVYYFNHKYERVGHLYQERFKSQPVEDEEYFVTLLRYIHQNPVKAGMVPGVGDYRWSSWHELMGDAEQGLCNTQRVLDLIDVAELKDLIDRPLTDTEEEGIIDYDTDDDLSDKVALKPSEILDLMLEYSGITCADEFVRLPKNVQRDCIGRIVAEGGTVREISRLTGIPKSTIHYMAAKWNEQQPPFQQVVADDECLEDYPDY